VIDFLRYIYFSLAVRKEEVETRLHVENTRHLPIAEARNEPCPSQVTFLSEYVWRIASRLG
jgi:hypothetical protein